MSLEKVTLALIAFQTLVALLEFGVTLDKKFKRKVEEELHIPVQDREE